MQALGQCLANLGPFSITMQFGQPQVLADGCVLLCPTHGAQQYRHLRQCILGPAVSHQGAHITVLHLRDAAGVTYDLAEITSALVGLATTLCTISLVEQHGSGPWLVRQEYRAAS